MNDDASSYGVGDEQDASDPYDINDPTEQDEYPDEVLEDDAPELDEEDAST